MIKRGLLLFRLIKLREWAERCGRVYVYNLFRLFYNDICMQRAEKEISIAIEKENLFEIRN